ncbi:pimeloyl-ACP methyl ester carboxylesterase [Sphingomonas naasensis]|uniref:Alpha/beta hydrolase n=1 Tax=Sphingomonas naasensis TaxID=1344951 RepID=A0A4S1WHC2_9SPHN|nr:alpha/beta hydrolase [Sphingomonas naasensis]NIJ21778.1 pimeloyl-ACP methyl ester carboxylesterase [Sphingomonas naasensis]TGX42518.1 alpha/beta hydrolase [Sphingomonas naasensis]
MARGLALFLTWIAAALGAAPAAALPDDAVEGRFDIGGRAIHLRCQGAGAPVVVVDAGFGTAAAEDQGWRRIADRIAPVTRVCLYDRAGLGGSDPAAQRPRTSLDAATDLRSALRRARVPGPYLLVGHSIGGLHAQVFASRFPADTAGLVLVSSTHPDQTRRWLALLPPAAPGEEKAITEARALLTSRLADRGTNAESLDVSASEDQARALRSLGAKPLIVATHSPRFRMVPGLSEPLAVKLEDATQDMQKGFLSLSSQARQNIAANAGHGLPHEDPGFVVDNILQGVAAVRSAAR